MNELLSAWVLAIGDRILAWLPAAAVAATGIVILGVPGFLERWEASKYGR